MNAGKMFYNDVAGAEFEAIKASRAPISHAHTCPVPGCGVWFHDAYHCRDMEHETHHASGVTIPKVFLMCDWHTFGVGPRGGQKHPNIRRGAFSAELSAELAPSDKAA